MFDFEIAFFLYKISKILSVFEGNKYKSEAYFKAAMAIDAYDRYASVLVAQNKLTNIEGIGESSAKIIREVVETGNCTLLQALENKYEISDYSLLLSYGLNNNLLKKLFDYKITDFNSLQNMIEQKFLNTKFKESEIRIIKGFADDYSEARGKYLFPYAYCLGNELVTIINKDIPMKISMLDLKWQEKVSHAHVVCLSNRYDYIKKLLVNSKRYNEIKEKPCEIECTSQFGLPIKISFTDTIQEAKIKNILRGDLHTHTLWSDGKHTIEQMAEQAYNLGRDYIGITDHSFSLRVANGISEVDAKQQIEEIRKLKMSGIKILAGIEIEVLKDGSLDFSDAILSQFDYVIAGIHTFLNQPSNQLLKRIEKALSNPYVNILAHPTSRLLGRPGILFSDRKSYDIHIDQIIDICKKNNIALEFNAFPERFDVAVKYFEKIFNNNIKLSVGTDAHSLAHLNCLDYAEIAIASFPKIKNSILNKLDAEELLQFFERQRAEKIVYTEFKHQVNVHNFEYFFGSNKNIVDGEYSVIGIDLTGSEAKASGWAVMKGNTVETTMLYTDDDLIRYSMNCKPRVVSIDSPLSYPKGRCCTKASCECKKYGITRYCERLLSSFGIGVYPCLIPSMVNLTTRGMKLAEKFRNIGVEVIESYPGVAQDILGIRRKQNGLQHLKNGYRNFGLIGEYLFSPNIKHDELDAIASALVGLFYINKQYVALGNDEENYLIVPSVAKPPKKPIVIGLAGCIGTGKTTLAEYLKYKHGFSSFRYSQIICELYKSSDDRETLQPLGAKIAEDAEKQKALSIAIIERIKQNPSRNYVIDGLRHKIDYETLREYFGDRFLFVCIEVNFKNLHHRYNKRNNCNLSKEEFQKIIYHESELDINMLNFFCKFTIRNNGTYKDYFETFENNLKEMLWQ